MIVKLFSILLKGVRGEHKMPGEFRSSQNWIGGATINDAVFVPPPHTHVNELMGDLEKFANDESKKIPDLLKIALIHYQFETIHPFLDGNGRVGRLLIALYLVSRKILKQPILYLSDFFVRHRQLYYDNLMIARTRHDINQWFRFFLTGVIETARQGIVTSDRILQLQKSLDERMNGMGARAADAKKVIEGLYSHPVTNATRIRKTIEKSDVSAYKLISDLEKIGVLHEMTGAQRGRIYMFKEYVDLFRSA